MNRKRIAELLRELADEFDVVAENDCPKQRRRPARRIVGPLNTPSDLDIAAARAAAKRLGHLVRRG